MRVYIALFLAGEGAEVARKNRQTQKSSERLLAKPKRNRDSKIWRVDVAMKVNTYVDEPSVDRSTDARNWRSGGIVEGSMHVVTTVKDEDIKPEEGLARELQKFTAHANAQRGTELDTCELVIIGHGANFCISGLSGARLALLLIRWGFKPRDALVNIVSCKAASEHRPVSIEELVRAEHVSWAKDFHGYLMMKGCKCVVKARCATVVVDKHGSKGTKFPNQQSAEKKQANSLVYLVARSADKNNGGMNDNNAPIDAGLAANELVQEIAFKNYAAGKGLTDQVWLSSVAGKAMPQSLTFVRTEAPVGKR